jgi:hypothetical protein
MQTYAGKCNIHRYTRRVITQSVEKKGYVERKRAANE